jgi:hypothetical protein
MNRIQYNAARVMPNPEWFRGEAPREREMVAQTTMCDPPPWVRSLACARDDKSILRSFAIPNPGRENPDRGTQLRGIRLNGDR